MKRFLFSIKYDGTAYHGWQVQSNALTVQEVFQNAVEKVFGKRLDVIGCSRTDSGVHADMYCLTLDTDMNITEEGAILALNSNLPSDIAVFDCREVDSDFHPRYNCNSKRYVYKIYNGKIRNPFLERFTYHYRYPIDAEYLNQESQYFVGKHDFIGFSSVNRDVEDTIRTINNISVKRDGDIVTITVEADGFLYNMVRIIVGTLIFVNEGKIAKGELKDVINSKERKRAGRTAPPQGLYLNKVNY